MPNNILFYTNSSPVVLTDDLFLAYGGSTGTSTASQRNVAYQTAEYLVQEYLNTFLVPTTVTGTFALVKLPIVLDHSFVQSLGSVIIYSRDRNSSCTLTSETSCAYLRNAKLGIVDVNLSGNCGCSRVSFDPYQVEISYQAYIPSGTVYNSPIMVALALAAQDELDEVTGESSTPGGVGIIEWENQEYREKRLALRQTLFGSSSRAQRISRLLSPFRVIKYAGL